jgi:hypothetical protein
MRIVEYLRSKGIHLKAIGGVYRAKCPFPDHVETKPSFTVWANENKFFCFGCRRVGGISRLMRLFGDPVPADMEAAEKAEREESDIKFNPIVRDRFKRITTDIVKIRKLRSRYTNQETLNNRVYKLITLLEGIKF